MINERYKMNLNHKKKQHQNDVALLKKKLYFIF